MKKFNYYEGLIWAFFTAIMLTIALPSKRQINICDSVEISISPNTTSSWLVSLETNLNTNNFPQIQYIQNFDWTSCLMCGTSAGTDTLPTFSFFSDTTQMYSVCLTVTYCTFNGLCFACTVCDTATWNNGSWELMSMMGNSNPTSITELTFNKINDGKIYDMLGRELTEVPLGTMYIRNNKLYITK